MRSPVLICFALALMLAGVMIPPPVATFYLRLSDRCIYDVRDIEALLLRLGRSGYRD